MSEIDPSPPARREAEASFPPAFPFLLLGPGILGDEPIAMTAETALPKSEFGAPLLFRHLLKSVAGTAGRFTQESLFTATCANLGALLRECESAILALTADHCLLTTGKKDRSLYVDTVPTLSLDRVGSVRDLMLTARLFDDLPGARRRWRFSSIVAELSPEDAAGPVRGWHQVLRTAASYWADTGSALYGPFVDLREAMAKAGFFEAGSAVREVRCIADIAHHPAMRDALARLAAPPAPGVWFKGTALKLNPQGLLMERLPFEDPLPRPQRLAA